MNSTGCIKCILFSVSVLLVISVAALAAPIDKDTLHRPGPAGAVLSGRPFQHVPLTVHGHWNFGPSTEVAMKGDTALTNCGAYLQVYNCADKNNPALIGERRFSRVLEDIEVQGEYAFVSLELPGMFVLDISDPANMVPVDSFGTRDDFAVGDVSVDGNLAITTAGKIAGGSIWMGIFSLDISDPYNIHALDSLECFWDDGETALLGDYVYVYDGDSLRVVDITNPADMQLLPSPGIPLDEVEDMAAEDNYLYIANGVEGLLVIDVSDPASPFVASSCKPVSGTYSDDISIWGNYAYIAKEFDMAVYDISDPTDCRCINESAGIELYNDDIAVIGNYAFLAGGDDGFYIVDVEFPNSLSLLGRHDMPSLIKDVAASGNYVFTANYRDGLRVFDTSPDTLPDSVLQNNWPEVVAASGNFVYAGSWAGFTAVDAGDPYSLAERSTFTLPFGGIRSIELAVDTAYVAWGESGLRILDIADPDAITEIGSYNTLGVAEDIVVSGNYAYIADGDEGLAAIDLSDPANPALADTLHMPTEIISIESYGNHVFLGDAAEGVAARIFIVDVSDPANPVSVGEINTFDENYDLEILGNHLYTGDYSGLKIFDISDPLAPKIRHAYRATDECYGVDISVSGTDTLVYLACDMGGLTILSNPLTGALVQSCGAFMAEGLIRLEWRLGEEIPESELSVYRKPAGGDTYTRLDDSGLHKTGAEYCFLDDDYTPGQNYIYRVVREHDGKTRMLFEVEFDSSAPRPMRLSQNRPNPFNPSTVIPFYIAERGKVSLAIYDVNGKLVSTLVDEIRSPGHYNEEWKGVDDAGRQVSSGVYFCRLVSNKKSVSTKMILLR